MASRRRGVAAGLLLAPHVRRRAAVRARRRVRRCSAWSRPRGSWLSARGASVERQLHADRVVEGEPLEATIEVRRGAPRPAGRRGRRSARTDAPVPLRPAAVAASEGRARRDVRVVTRFPRRGLRRLEPPSLIVSDTLELARACVGYRAHRPRSCWCCRAPSRSGGQRASAPAGRTATAGAAACRAARGGRRRRPASLPPGNARLADPLARARPRRGPARAAAAGRRRHAPAGRARCARGGPAEQLDAAVRAAASLMLELARRGGCGLLLPGERRPSRSSPTRRAGRAPTPGCAGRGRPEHAGARCSPPARDPGPCSTSPRSRSTGCRQRSQARASGARVLVLPHGVLEPLRRGARASRCPAAMASCCAPPGARSETPAGLSRSA